jgi:hypothetical protein
VQAPGIPTLVAELETRLRARSRGRISVVLTSNQVRLVSVRHHRSVAEVRVSRRVLERGEEAIEAVTAFVCDGAKGRSAMRSLMATLPPPERRPPRRYRTRHAGRTHDLRALLSAESMRAFGEEGSTTVTWGVRRRMRRSQRTIRLGSYAPEERVIRIHPLLDQPAVPDWFVGFVLYHELLHHRLGAGVEPGAKTGHPPLFREAERQHPRFQDARAWEREVLPRLMRRGLPW